jgi:uncharacterized protein (TIRG00374 family)
MIDNLKKNWLRYGLTVAVLVGLVLAGVRYLNGAEVMAALRNFNYLYAPIMLGLSTLYLGLKAWRFLFLIRPLTSVPAGPIFRGYVAGQAATLVPAGIAARAGLMLQLGIPIAKSSGPVLFSSLLDQVMFIVGALIAALWFKPARIPAGIALSVMIVIVVILFVPSTRQILVGAGNWLAGRFHFRKQWENFLAALPQFVTLRIMAITLAITAVAFLLHITTLGLTLNGVDNPISIPSLFLAYILPTMFGRFLPVPGGVGVTEAGMVGFLELVSEISVDKAAAAVAIFRVATIVWEALVGALFYFFAWKGTQEATAMAVEEA